MPLHATGVGQVLLAFAHASVQEEVLAGPLSALTPRTVTDPHALRRTLAGVRREGVAVCDGMVDLLSLSVAAPIRGEDDRVVAAMSVVVPSAGSDPRTIVPAVRADRPRDLPGPGLAVGAAPSVRGGHPAAVPRRARTPRARPNAARDRAHVRSLDRRAGDPPGRSRARDGRSAMRQVGRVRAWCVAAGVGVALIGALIVGAGAPALAAPGPQLPLPVPQPEREYAPLDRPGPALQVAGRRPRRRPGLHRRRRRRVAPAGAADPRDDADGARRTSPGTTSARSPPTTARTARSRCRTTP